MTGSPLHPDPDRVAVAGDWHGNLRWAERMIQAAADDGASAVVHLGDFGYWTDDPSTRKYLSRLEKLLTATGIQLLWVDGNHENHDRLDRQPINPVTGLRTISEHIHHLPRGFRWTWHGKVWMGLGGAHSVDRAAREPGKSWWAREFTSEAEIEYAKRDGQVDVMVCHDAPDGVDIPAIRGVSDWPEYDLAESALHRRRIGDVVRAVRPSVLFHGHYHCRYDDGFRHLNGLVTSVHGLSEDDSYQQGNMLMLNLNDGGS
jgi:hypothetical protein